MQRIGCATIVRPEHFVIVNAKDAICKTKIFKEFDKIESKKKSFQEGIKINSIQKDLDKFSENITNSDHLYGYREEFKQSETRLPTEEESQVIVEEISNEISKQLSGITQQDVQQVISGEPLVDREIDIADMPI